MPRVKKSKPEKVGAERPVEEKVEKKADGSFRPEKPKPVKKPKKPKKSKKEKVKRKPSAYASFVREIYHTEEIMALPSKQRFKAISVLWKKEKEKSTK